MTATLVPEVRRAVRTFSIEDYARVTGLSRREAGDLLVHWLRCGFVGCEGKGEWYVTPDGAAVARGLGELRV